MLKNSMFLILLFLLVGCIEKKMERIDFDFRGIRLGDTIDDDMRSRFGDRPLAKNVTQLMKSSGYSISGEFEIGGEKVRVAIQELEGKVSEIYIGGFDEKTFLDAMLVKYGLPHTKTSKSFVWIDLNGTVTLSKSTLVATSNSEYDRREREAGDELRDTLNDM